MKPKFLLIVKPVAGLVTLDTPRPRGEGAVVRRTLAKGTQVYAYDILNFQGVPYAWLVPADPLKPEWSRVSEKGSIVPEYLEQFPIDPEPGSETDIVGVLLGIKAALEIIANYYESKTG